MSSIYHRKGDTRITEPDVFSFEADIPNLLQQHDAQNKAELLRGLARGFLRWLTPQEDLFSSLREALVYEIGSRESLVDAVDAWAALSMKNNPTLDEQPPSAFRELVLSKKGSVSPDSALLQLALCHGLTQDYLMTHFRSSYDIIPPYDGGQSYSLIEILPEHPHPYPSPPSVQRLLLIMEDKSSPFKKYPEPSPEEALRIKERDERADTAADILVSFCLVLASRGIPADEIPLVDKLWDWPLSEISKVVKSGYEFLPEANGR